MGRHAKINIWEDTLCIWVSSINILETPAAAILTEEKYLLR
jgi:hypothetical protein